MKFKKQNLRIIVLSILSVLVFLIIASAIFYKPIVRFGIRCAIAKVEDRFGLKIVTSAINIHSPLHYTIIGFSVHSTTDQSTFVNMDSICVGFSAWSLLAFSPELSKLHCFQGTIQLGDVANLQQKFQKYRVTQDSLLVDKKLNFIDLSQRYLGILHHRLPKNLLINKVDIYAVYQHKRLKIDVDTFVLYQQKLQSLASFRLNDVVSKWKLEGLISDDEEGKYQCQITALQPTTATFPLLSFFTSSTLEFSDLYCEAEVTKINSSYKTISLELSTPKVKIFNAAISSEKVPINKFSLTLDLDIFPHQLQIDSTSKISINGLTLSPYLFINNEEDLQVDFKILRQQISAQKILQALPSNVFTTLDGLELSGSFLFDVTFSCQFNALDSLHFDYTFTPRNVAILSTGNSIFSRSTTLFTHPVKVRNPDGTYYYRRQFLDYRSSRFLPMEQIPRYVVSSILTREDPTFFTHKGIMKSAIQEALVVDIKKRKFTRGASTISMQWVKNIYLDNDKTICRKLEELLLVSLIEQLRWISKNRIFEMYVSLIEWAPNVYGLYDASAFYFDKTPQQLTLGESLFLALIIPSPGKFYTHFDKEGNYKPEQQERIQSTAKLMLSRNLISNAEYETLDTHIKIKVKPEEMKALPTIDEEDYTLDE